jgi:uncharacterized membrane protein
MTIKNPIEWSGAQLVHAAQAIGSLGRSLNRISDNVHSAAPAVRPIGLGDLRDAIVRGFEDFKAYRSDVIIVGIIYVVVGIVLGRAALGRDLLPLLFPLASGFAIVGPFAAVGLYEMSRRREQGLEVSWANGIEMLREPGFGAIAVLGLVLVAIFGLWIASAWWIFQATLGPALPASLGAFIHDVVATHAGHVMIGAGIAVGFVFALAAMAISVVSFPLLLDHEVGLDTAVRTSIRAVVKNPKAMAAWGLIVAAGLLIGSLSLFVGLAVVLPVLGHATWHLYRKLVVTA